MLHVYQNSQIQRSLPAPGFPLTHLLSVAVMPVPLIVLLPQVGLRASGESITSSQACVWAREEGTSLDPTPDQNSQNLHFASNFNRLI